MTLVHVPTGPRHASEPGAVGLGVRLGSVPHLCRLCRLCRFVERWWGAQVSNLASRSLGFTVRAASLATYRPNVVEGRGLEPQVSGTTTRCPAS